MMRRDECLKKLAEYHTNEIVVPVFQAAFEWMVFKPDALNYLGVGAMGQASSHALGLAIGRPDKRVIVLDGDGSLLMNLGTLVTIAEAGPSNLIHFVCVNKNYETNGSHPIPGAQRIDFCGFAKAAGYPKVHEFFELGAFEAKIADLLQETGPVFVALHVSGGGDYPQDFVALHSADRRRQFAVALASS